MAPITIRGTTIDPDANEDGTPSRYTSKDAANTNYIYIQAHTTLDYVRALPFVKHANCYHRAFKVSRTLKQILSTDGEVQSVYIKLHKGARSSAEVAVELREVEGMVEESMEVCESTIYVDVTKEALEGIEKIDDVEMVHEVVEECIPEDGMEWEEEEQEE